MPGDALVARPQLEATRAVAIGAPPAAVWPWLVQMGGSTRAGWYSYDRIDNAGRRSADTIVPDLQHLEVGDVLPTAADGAGFEVVAIEPGRWLVLRIDDPRAVIAVTVQVDPSGPGHSRLVFRLRQRAPDWRGWPFLLAMDIGDFWFMRKQLLGIRERAERHWREARRASLRPAA